MSHKLVNANGHLSVDVYYEIEGIPDQMHWNNKDTWRPTSVHLQFSTDKRWGASLPRSTDLTTLDLLGESSPLAGVTVHGVKLKRKDGLPGKVPTSEHFYSGYDLPPWLAAIVQEALLGMSCA